VFTETTRPLTREERAQFESRRDELRRQAAAEAASHRSNVRGAAMGMALVSAFFLAIVIFNLVSGSKAAALAALCGVIIFGALVIWILRSNNDLPLGSGEIELLSLTLDKDTLLVYEIRAEKALTIGSTEPEGGIWGDLLQVGPDEVVYVSRRTCARVDAEHLPNTALYLERAVPFGVTKAEARGARIATPLRVALSDRLYDWVQIPSALEAFVLEELVPFPGDVAALARSLSDPAPTG
jgi:hypothetical protein